MVRTLYTGGTFDLFHYGHLNFLRQCASLADNVYVSLNTDEFIEEYKGKPPIINYDQRREILLSIYEVTAVVPNTGGADSKPAILGVRPDIVAIGDDWAAKDYYKQMNFTQEWLDDHGITLVYLPYYKGISTTLIKEKIRAN